MLKHRLTQAGDTIVEVLVVLAVLGLSFGIAYATANRGLAQSRNAEEHSEALGLLSSQVEMVRSAALIAAPTSATNNVFDSSSTFCLDESGGTIQYNAISGSYPSACVMGANLYQVSVKCSNPASPSASTPCTAFLATATWQGLGDFGQQQEQISYDIAQPGTAPVGFSNSINTGVNAPQPNAPISSSPSGTTFYAASAPNTITLTATDNINDPLAICYTTNGAQPTYSNGHCAGGSIQCGQICPVTLTTNGGNETIEAISVDTLYSIVSSPFSATYTIVPPILPLTINLAAPQSCTISALFQPPAPVACPTGGGQIPAYSGFLSGMDINYDISQQEAGRGGPATITVTYSNPCPPGACGWSFFGASGTVSNSVSVYLNGSSGNIYGFWYPLGASGSVTASGTLVNPGTLTVTNAAGGLFGAGPGATITQITLTPG